MPQNNYVAAQCRFMQEWTSRTWDYTNSVRRFRWSINRYVLNSYITAIDRMDVVCRGIQESKIRNYNISGCQKLHKMRAAVVQGMRGEPIPPNWALAIDGSIITCYHHIPQHIPVYQASISSSRKFDPSTIRRKGFYDFPMWWILRPKNDSTSFQEECEVAREIETSSKPLPWWHIKLSATLISKRFEIKYGILEGNGVQCFPIPDCAKLQDRYTVWSGIQCQIICALSTPFLSITFNSIAQYQNHKQWQ